jgi:multidrug efflux pump subunit AcrB
MLIGLVTKNGILIVELQISWEQGKPKLKPFWKLLEARLRPILMTSLAIALGALPPLSLGAASTRIGMGVVIVGGTVFHWY